VHIYSANLIMLMIPFTKIAHWRARATLAVVTAASWKFVPGAGIRCGHAGLRRTANLGRKFKICNGGAKGVEERKEIYAK